MERARENEYSLLRVICCAAVVVLHTGSIYLAGWTPGMPNLLRTGAGLLQSLTRDAVPLFVMLSGAFLLLDDRNQKLGYFYRKSFRKLGIPTLVFSALYVAYAYAVVLGKIYIKHTAGTELLWEPLQLWLEGVPYFHMWFMYMLMGLYAAAPFLIRFRSRVGEPQWFAAGILCLAAGMALSDRMSLPWFLQWLLYVGYFMLGAAIRRHYREKGRNPLGNVCLAAGLAVLVGAAWLFHRKLWYGVLPEYELIHPLSGLVALSSILIFAGFARRRVPTDLGIHSGLTFYIYLFHGGVLSFLDLFIRNVLKWNPGMFQLLLTAVLTYLISWGLSVFWVRGVGRLNQKYKSIEMEYNKNKKGLAN